MSAATADYPLFIDGRSRWPEARPRIERLHPASRERVATFACASPEDVADAVAAARRSARDWSRRPPAERSAFLLAAAQAIEAEEACLAASLEAEVGKPRSEALAEVREGVALWRYAAGSLRSLHGEFHPNLGPGVRGFTRLEPVGIVALILPWNFPFLVAAERLPFILAAGCTVVVKPSEHAGGVSIQVAEILTRAGLPDGVYNVVTGLGHETGAALVAHPDVAMVSFTGSSENGRMVMESAARTLKRVSLELGGKSPVVVFADADLERAAEGVLQGFTYNAGQCCIATTRLILERACAERFKALLLDRIQAARAAGALDQAVATVDQFRRVKGILSAGGGRALCGGDPWPDGQGLWVPPTILEDLPVDSPVVRSEIFGPVLSVHLFDGEAEAVDLANDTVYGLAAAVWSGDVDRALRVADAIRAGRLWINSPQVNFPELPVGGFGWSGIGREAGSTGILGYCETKSYIMRS